MTLGDDLGHKLSSSEQELITSLTSGGALVGAIVAGLPADKFGRKFGIYVGCALFLLGSIIQAAAYSVVQMAVGRFVVGLGVGSAAMIIVSSTETHTVGHGANSSSPFTSASLLRLNTEVE